MRSIASCHWDDFGSNPSMLSIIIVAYNNANIIGECFDSIMQLELEDFELIIVDNYSTDGTRELLLEKTRSSDKYTIQEWAWMMRLILNPANEGLSKATNRAFKLSRGDMILLSNPDVIYTQRLRWLLKLLSFEYTDENGGYILAPRLLNLNGSVQNAIHRKRITLKRILWGWTRLGNYFDKKFLSDRML